MAEEIQTRESAKGLNKRKSGQKKGIKAKKKFKISEESGQKVKIDRKMRKLFRKRARDYNSDDEEDPSSVINYNSDDEENPSPVTKNLLNTQEAHGDESSDGEGEVRMEAGEDHGGSDDENGDIQPGITKFTEGCKAFRMAFKKIIKKIVTHDVPGPVLSAHKKLVAEKLAEDDAEWRVKGDAKKEKHLAGEKGHVKPATFLDSREKFLIGVATKGVVKLFNAVNKAQHSQKGLNPSRSKDAKEIHKRRKEAFLSELGKATSGSAGTPVKIGTSTGPGDEEGPTWAPLRDNYMLTKPKLKDWDKMPDKPAVDDFGGPTDSSSDDD